MSLSRLCSNNLNEKCQPPREQEQHQPPTSAKQMNNNTFDNIMQMLSEEILFLDQGNQNDENGILFFTSAL